LVVSDEEASALLEELDRDPDAAPHPRPTHAPVDEVDDGDDALGRLVRLFRLTPEERRAVVAALAPRSTARYERVFAFLPRRRDAESARGGPPPRL